MSGQKRPLSAKDNELLFHLWDDSRIGKGRPYSVRQLANYFNRNQPRILKELNMWKGFQRNNTGQPVISLQGMSLEEAEKENGSK